MSKQTLRLTGAITLRSPLAITLPGATDGAKTTDPTPVPSTIVYEPGAGMVDTAYIPASSFRGTLRRAGHDALNRRLRQMGRELLDLRSFYMLRIGGVKNKGSEGQSKDVSGEAALRERNPFVSLFGAADAGTVSFLAGRLEVDHALPRVPLNPAVCPAFASMRTDDMLRSPEASLSALPASAASVWKTLFEASINTSALKKRKKALEREAAIARSAKDAAKLTAVQEELAEVNDVLAEAPGSIAQPLAGYRAIPAGTVLDLNITVNRGNEAELGAFFDALDAMSLDPAIGGHRNHGCGRFAASWAVTATTFTDEGKIERERLGTIDLDESNGLKVEGGALKDIIERSIKAWAKAVDEGDFVYHKAARGVPAEEAAGE